MATQQAIQLLKKAQTDPGWWMSKACGWGLWEKQREVANALACHERVAVPAAFGVGKTYFAARAALWWLFTHKPSKVITTAPTLRQTKDLLWSELRAAHRRSRRPLGGEPLTLSLKLEEDWYALGFATDPDKIDQFTGYHSPHMMVIFDQASGIDRVVWQAAEGLMTGGHARWLAISNTTDSSSALAEICNGDEYGSPEFRRSEFGTWKVMKITAYDSPNVRAGCDVIPGIISHDWIDKKREIWDPNDPMWQIFVEANFVDEAQMTFLNGAMIRSMLESDLAPDYEHIVVGLDIADEGLDSTVWTVRAGPRLLFIEQVHGNDPMQVSNHTLTVCERVEKLTGKRPHHIIADRIGVGSGVCARLAELNQPVYPLNVSVSPNVDPEQFLNLRAQLGWRVRELAMENQICLRPLFPTPDQHIKSLKEELTLRYKILSSGKIQMEPKKEVRKRLQRSPDFWDSMMLSFSDSYEASRITFLPAEGTKSAQTASPDGPITFEEALRLWLRQDDDQMDDRYVDSFVEFSRDGDGFLNHSLIS